MENQINCPIIETKKVISQKDAVYTFFCQVTTDSSLTKKEVRKAIRELLIVSIKAGNVKCNKNYDDKALAKYCSCLISNWVNKDVRLNNKVLA